MTMRPLDFYEFAGIIAPGMFVLIVVGTIWPGVFKSVSLLEVSLGGFGVALLMAYVAGHLLQAVGNLFETGWWAVHGGWPSDWPRTRKGRLLSDSQIALLQERVRIDLGLSDVTLDARLPADAWHPVFRQIYARVYGAGKDGRAHTFNGNYGMFRGIAAAAFLSAVLVLVGRGLDSWPAAAGLAAAGVLAVSRMHRFGKHYARETYLQFLTLPQLERTES
ncbi:MAG: hypothetical protein ACREMQ_00960 [Longimicrobiales bacterium]